MEDFITAAVKVLVAFVFLLVTVMLMTAVFVRRSVSVLLAMMSTFSSVIMLLTSRSRPCRS